MAVMQTLDELKNWDEYRVFLRKYLKLLSVEEAPFYVSKARIDFDINGKAWKGYAILLGRKSRKLAQKMRQEGELFLEGTCTSDGKRLRLQGLSEKHVKGAERTLRRMKLGFGIEGAGDESEGSEGAAAPASPSDAPRSSGDDAARERAWPRRKARAIGRIRAALAEGGPNVRALREAARAMQRLERDGDYDGATRALRRVLALIDRSASTGSASSADDAPSTPSSTQASAEEGATAQAQRAEGDLPLLAQRIERAVELWSNTERAATRELRKLQRAIQRTGDPRARAIVQGLESVRTNLERLDDEAREAAEAARSGERAAFETARADFRTKVRRIEQRIARDPMIADADANPFVSTRIREVLLASIGRLRQAI